MRRRAALAAASAMAMALAVIAAPRAAAQGYYAKRVSLAFADWIRPLERPNHYRWTGAFVFVRTDAQTGKERRYGGIVSGRCVLKRQRNGSSMTCSGVGTGLDKADVFEMDPAAQGARLVVTEGGRTHRVAWTATDDPPGVYQSYEACAGGGEEGEGQGGGLFREATAEGKIYGRPVATNPDSDWEWAALASGASVTECDFVRDLLNGGAISLAKARPPRSV